MEELHDDLDEAFRVFALAHHRSEPGCPRQLGFRRPPREEHGGLHLPGAHHLCREIDAALTAELDVEDAHLETFGPRSRLSGGWDSGDIQPGPREQSLHDLEQDAIVIDDKRERVPEAEMGIHAAVAPSFLSEGRSPPSAAGTVDGLQPADRLFPGPRTPMS